MVKASKVTVFELHFSRVCGFNFVVFEDVWSKRVGLQCFMSTVCDDLLVAFEQAWAGVMVLERGLSRVCGDTFVAFEDVWSKMGAQALGRVYEPWSVRI